MSIHQEYQTPEDVVAYMVNMIPKGTKTVLEPSRGEGGIVTQLEGYEVTAPIDFFLMKKRRFDCVVMNPPFSEKSCRMENAPEGVNMKGMRTGYYFLNQCMEMSDSIIALVPWFTIIDSDKRSRMLKDYGMRSLTALPRKTFQYARIQTCIIELEKGYLGSTEYRVYDLIK